MSFEQRFGGSLNAHFYYHIVVSDGGFDHQGEFIHRQYLKRDDREQLIHTLRHRLLRYLKYKSLLSGDSEATLRWDHFERYWSRQFSIASGPKDSSFGNWGRHDGYQKF